MSAQLCRAKDHLSNICKPPLMRLKGDGNNMSTVFVKKTSFCYLQTHKYVEYFRPFTEYGETPFKKVCNRLECLNCTANLDKQCFSSKKLDMREKLKANI